MGLAVESADMAIARQQYDTQISLVRQYEAALVDTARCRAWIADAFAGFDLIIAPSAPSEAPELSNTGEPTFGLMWTLLQLPCLTLPCGTGATGLPLGLQVIAAAGCDPDLYAGAGWIEHQLAR